MFPYQTPAVHLLHRLLFDALLEIRSQGHEQRNKAVYHLADLFHNVVLEMENAAEGKLSYEEVLALMLDRAKEKGCEEWVSNRASRIEESAARDAPPQPPETSHLPAGR